jgi:hypothetical protein
MPVGCKEIASMISFTNSGRGPFRIRDIRRGQLTVPARLPHLLKFRVRKLMAAGLRIRQEASTFFSINTDARFPGMP